MRYIERLFEPTGYTPEEIKRLYKGFLKKRFEDVKENAKLVCITIRSGGRKARVEVKMPLWDYWYLRYYYDHLKDKFFSELSEIVEWIIPKSELSVDDSEKYKHWVRKFDETVEEETSLRGKPKEIKSVEREFLVNVLGDSYLFDEIFGEVALLWLLERTKKEKITERIKRYFSAMKNFPRLLEHLLLFREVSRRVLGMYEVTEFIKGRINHDALLFFDQNIKEVSAENCIESHIIGKVTVIHELIHLKHFNSYPHLEKIRGELVRNEHYIETLKPELPKREYSALSSRISEAQEAFFSVCEGYAEFYTEKIGEKVLPEYYRVKSLRSRRGLHPFVRRSLEKIVRRYASGKRFVENVLPCVEEELFKEENLPLSMREIEHPELYLNNYGFR